MEGLHVSPTHVACKRGDTKGRGCVVSGLNEGTDMEVIEESLGQLSLPGLQELATLLHNAYQRGARCMFKTDVSFAFNRIKLSHDAVLSQATQADNLILLRLVAVIGWTASPIYYSLVSDARGELGPQWRRHRTHVGRVAPGPRKRGAATTPFIGRARAQYHIRR
jgi:hypothetical protein